ATLAVSIEPVGGSKTGAPTGPVVAKGALSPV
ncbi:MAG: anti-sigma factor, partial [Lysobacteraceae bacterium]